MSENLKMISRTLGRAGSRIIMIYGSLHLELEIFGPFGFEPSAHDWRRALMSLYTGFAVSLNHKLHGNMFCMQYKTSWGRTSQPVTSHSCSPARCMISGFKASLGATIFRPPCPPPPPQQGEVQHTGLAMKTWLSPTQNPQVECTAFWCGAVGSQLPQGITFTLGIGLLSRPALDFILMVFLRLPPAAQHKAQRRQSPASSTC